MPIPTVRDRCKTDDGRTRHTKRRRLPRVLSLCRFIPWNASHGHLRNTLEANQARCGFTMGQTLQIGKPKRGRRKRTARTMLGAVAICWLIYCLVLTIRVRYSAYVKRRAAAIAFHSMRDIARDCEALEFVSPSRESASEDLTPDKSNLVDLVTLTDALFVLTKDECKSSLPSNIPWACVKGKVVDACIPKQFEALIGKHGYATSVSHAFIFMHAHLQEYRHVTILEDDAIFSQSVRGSMIDDVRAVLQGPNDWSFVRLGYRPFFLEVQHKKSTQLHFEDPFSCPAPCVCEKFGTSMCRMVENGCDVRSSHFYMANARVFERVIADLLDVSDEHRIIDWFVLHRYSNQVYASSNIATQEALDIPRELQEGYTKLFTRLCVA